MPTLIGEFARDDAAVSAMEYAFLAALIAMVAIAGIAALGAAVKDLYDSIASRMPPAPGP